MVPYRSSPVTEDLGSFLQDLPPGGHYAVDLEGLDFGTAAQVAKVAASDRGEEFILVGGPDGWRGSLEEAVAAWTSGATGKAPQRSFIAVDAEASMAMRGAASHAEAESQLSPRQGDHRTIVCLYTLRSRLAVQGAFDGCHEEIARPGAGPE